MSMEFQRTSLKPDVELPSKLMLVGVSGSRTKSLISPLAPKWVLGQPRKKSVLVCFLLLRYIKIKSNLG